MDRVEEAKVDKMIDNVGKSYHQFPNGRSFLAFSGRDKLTKEALKKYRNNYDRIFPNAPGAGI